MSGVLCQSNCASLSLRPPALDFWQRHLWQLNPERPYMNSFTRWRVSALYPVRQFMPHRDTMLAPKPKKGKARG